ncbi:hypothetical protein [Streptomyces sp. S186]|uniref:hypothetical protein n=1 Tax=Streptomyces sp. S186 TaxID=3434395 RepID=UPI003F67329F
MPGIWCERTVYRSVHADEVASWTFLAVGTPLRAVGAIAADARRLAADLPRRAREWALRGVAGEGRVAAVAALHRGEPCGLALSCAGTWVEWSATPVLFLPVVSGGDAPEADHAHRGYWQDKAPPPAVEDTAP